MSGRVGKSILAGATLLELDPAKIDVSGRIGFYFEDKATAFGHLMFRDGQRDPIKVSRNKAGAELPWRLHVGLHRTMGARMRGLPVFALEVSGTPEQLRELESSENLHRRVIEPIERAKFVFHVCEAARVRIAREHGDLKQQELAIKARWDRVKGGESRVEEALTDELVDTCDNLSRVYSWSESAAEALDMGKREIYRSLELYRLVIEPFPELAEALAHHPVVGNNASQLKAIAAVRDEPSRRAVIEALLADPEIGADDARILAGVRRENTRAPMPHEKHFDAIAGGWSRLGLAHKREFLPRFVRSLTPDLKAQLRQLLDAEDGE